jgi:tRNA-Thr(GGU) m(6)t(6)A37 methyltransferase TsaA
VVDLPSLFPIGAVRSEIRQRKDMPPLGVPAAIEILPEFIDGLLHLDKHSHLWILAWLETDRDVLRVTPRGVPEGPQGLHGVFAVRSPTRPNPIGLTAVRVVSHRGNRIMCDRLDFIDGTPVVDVKPYFVTRDMIFAAANAQIGRPADREAVYQALLMQGESFCGSIDADVAFAAEILAHFRCEVLGFADPPEWRVTVPSSRPGLGDAFMAMTRVRLGNQTLRLREQGGVTLEAAGIVRTYD